MGRAIESLLEDSTKSFWGEIPKTLDFLLGEKSSSSAPSRTAAVAELRMRGFLTTTVGAVSFTWPAVEADRGAGVRGAMTAAFLRAAAGALICTWKREKGESAR